MIKKTREYLRKRKELDIERCKRHKAEELKKKTIHDRKVIQLHNDFEDYLRKGFCPRCSRFVNPYNKLYYDEKNFMIFCDACRRDNQPKVGIIF